MNNKLEILLANGHKLVAELCEYGSSEIAPEIVVCIQDENGIAIQDGVLVRAGEDNSNIEVLVWADQYDEDYTHKFEIEEYKEEN